MQLSSRLNLECIWSSANVGKRWQTVWGKGKGKMMAKWREGVCLGDFRNRYLEKIGRSNHVIAAFITGIIAVAELLWSCVLFYVDHKSRGSVCLMGPHSSVPNIINCCRWHAILISNFTCKFWTKSPNTKSKKRIPTCLLIQLCNCGFILSSLHSFSF